MTKAKAKYNPPVGALPVLQYCAPDQLQIDADYQRSLESVLSQRLIVRIARDWDWGLCQPLFVARRNDGGLYVVDGQHRLAAAKLRGDIWQLPCVVTAFESASAEAASFVQLNQQRRPLTDLELFKASIASGDPEACQIVSLIEDAGLSLATSTDNTRMRPGAIANVGGLRRELRLHGDLVIGAALKVLARAFAGETLRYAGSIFPGVVALVADQADSLPSDQVIADTAAFLARTKQSSWYQGMLDTIAGNPVLNRKLAMVTLMRLRWIRRKDPPAAVRTVQAVEPGGCAPPVLVALKPAEMAWCDQCDQRRSGAQAAACTSQFCSLKEKAAA